MAILSHRLVLAYSRNLLAYGIRLAMYIGMGFLVATVRAFIVSRPLSQTNSTADLGPSPKKGGRATRPSQRPLLLRRLPVLHEVRLSQLSVCPNEC